MRRFLLFLAALTTGLGASAVQARPAIIDEGTLTYHVDHRFKSFDAVMPASAVEVVFDLDPASPETLSFEARIPLASFDSGNQLRDEHAAEALELFLFADASWTAQEVKVTEREPAEGSLSKAILTASGPLTLHGETHTLTADVLMAVAGDRVAIQATFPISLDEYGIRRPGLLGFKIDDTVTVTVDLTATLR